MLLATTPLLASSPPAEHAVQPVVADGLYSRRAGPAQPDARVQLRAASKKEQRALLHVGPPKTASTHIQSVFEQLISAGDGFDECWQWQNASNDKVAELADALEGPLGSPEMFGMARKLKRTADAGCSSFLSSETFSCLSGPARSRAQIHWLPPPIRVDVVIIYRSDRVATLHSVYSEYRGSFCTSHCGITGNSGTDSIAIRRDQPCPSVDGSSWLLPSHWVFKLLDNYALLDGVSMINTRGIAERFATTFGRDSLRIIHLEGTEAAGLDVVEVIGCEVMGMPCTPEGHLPIYRQLLSSQSLIEHDNNRHFDDKDVFDESVRVIARRHAHARCNGTQYAPDKEFSQRRLEDLVLWARVNGTRHCSQLHALHSALAAHDLEFVARFQDRFLRLNTSVIYGQNRTSVDDTSKWCEPDPVHLLGDPVAAGILSDVFKCRVHPG